MYKHLPLGQTRRRCRQYQTHRPVIQVEPAVSTVNNKNSTQLKVLRKQDVENK